jgi:cyclopropane fatty-acyl-phospholipid synthase-like methyltransferase
MTRSMGSTKRTFYAKIARDARRLAATTATWGGSQNFLGARWVEYIVNNTPQSVRPRVAMWLLSLSPHYFYDQDIYAEAERNRVSRIALTDALIAPHLHGDMRVLDYGCGPGYMAYAVASRVKYVDAVDISRGVLACARAINGRSNIRYMRLDELSRERRQVDLAYSFAVIQHLGRAVLAEMVGVLADSVREDGQILLHFVVPDHRSWRSEEEWRASRSLANRLKLHYGLNCFARSQDEMVEIVSSSGFTDVAIRPLNGTIAIPGDNDIPTQHLLTARRK